MGDIDFKAAVGPELAHQGLEHLRGQGFDRPAGVAGEVDVRVVVNGVVGGGAVADVGVGHEPDLLEHLEGPVNGGEVHSRSMALDLSQDLLWSAVAEGVHRIITGEPVSLIETLAERIAEFALGHSLVTKVEVAVHKPAAPIKVPFDDVVVRVVRAKES